MKIAANFTKKEALWLDAVLRWGAEIIDFMLVEGYLADDRDWHIIQYQLYARHPFTLTEKDK